MIQLYFDGKPLDIGDNDLIYSLSAGLLDKDLTTTKSYTNSFNLPLSNQNLRALGYPNASTAITSINRNIKFPCDIRQNNAILFSGYLRVQNVDTEAKTIQCSFIGNNADFFSAIANKKLTDLNLSYLDEDINLTYPPPAFDSTKNIPFVNYGTIDENTGFDENLPLFPMISCATVLNQICLEAGYAPPEEILQDRIFSKLYFIFGNKEIRYADRTIKDLKTTITDQSGRFMVQEVQNSSRQLNAAVPLGFDSVNNRPFVLNNGMLEASAIQNKPSGFRVTQNAIVSIEVDITLTDIYYTTSTFPSVNQLKFKISPTFKGNGAPQQDDVVLNTQVLSSNSVRVFGVINNYSNNARINRFEIYTYWDGLPTDAQRVAMRYKVTGDFTVKIDGSSNVIDRIAAINTITWNYDANLPNLTQKEFVKEILVTLGYLLLPNPQTRTIKAVKIENLLTDLSGAIDLSDKFDNKGYQKNLVEYINNYAQSNTFEYKADTTNTAYFTDQIPIVNEFLEQEKELYKSPFSVLQTKAAFNVDEIGTNDVCFLFTVPILELDENLDLYRFNGDEYTVIAQVIEASLSDFQKIPTNTNKYNYAYQIMPVTLLPIDAKTRDTYPFGLYGNTNAINNRLILERYSALTRVLQNGEIIEAKFNLGYKDIKNLDFTKLVYIDKLKSYYYVIEIKDYTGIQGDLTTLKLLKV